MKNLPVRKGMVGGIVLNLAVLLLSACNLPVRAVATGLPPTVALTARAAQTPLGGAIDTPAAPNTTEAVAPTDTPTQTATIAHLTTPGTPGAVEWYVADYSSKSTAAEKRAPGGDSYPYNLYERPFRAEDMQYLPGIDLIRAEIHRSGDWFYVTIRLQESPTDEEKASARYGVEVDTDLDGRGDYLIWAAAPAGTTWSTDGVQVWTDKNNDVGGPVPIKLDAPNADRNGYDELVFDQGLGADPDAAWARFAPEDAKRVQIAFKPATIGNDADFLWGVWADAGSKQPGWFDYDDHFTFAEAGSPLKGNVQYPLKALEALDNTCLMSYGFMLLGTEPGACYVESPTATPTATSTPTIYFRSPIGPIKLFRVTSVVVFQNKDTYSGPCRSLNYSFWGQITVNGAGDVVYVFEQSVDDGPFGRIIGIKTMNFTSAGTKNTDTFNMSGGSGVVRTRIQIMSPNVMYSNVVSVTITCT
jgi:hypothetical protein